jgi:hypothetical protein
MLQYQLLEWQVQLAGLLKNLWVWYALAFPVMAKRLPVHNYFLGIGQVLFLRAFRML